MSYNEPMPSTKKPAKTEAQFLKDVRARRGISQRKLAAMLGKNYAYIAHTESGNLTNSIELFKALAPMLTQEEKLEIYNIFCLKTKKSLGL